jgi:hypothetical protein
MVEKWGNLMRKRLSKTLWGPPKNGHNRLMVSVMLENLLQCAFWGKEHIQLRPNDAYLLSNLRK